MLDLIKILLRKPEFADANDQRIASLLHVSALTLFAGAIVIAVILGTTLTTPASSFTILLVIAPTLVVAVASLGIEALMRRGYLRQASLVLSFMLFVAVTMANYSSGRGLRNTGTAGYILVIILATLLLGGRLGPVLFTTMSFLVGLVFYLAEANGLVTYVQSPTVQVVDIGIYAILFIATALLLGSAVQNLIDALARAQDSERALAKSNEQLQDLNEDLEQRVAERTRALEISAAVSRRLSTILNENQLVSEVVEEVRNAYNYYHVHIYLLDKATDRLVMAGGTGEAGRIMLTNNHSIAVGQGVVGRAAATNSAFSVPDVTKDPNWLPNALLPDTRSEAAVPIAIGDDVFGVLDVQQNVVNGLDAAAVDLLQSIADQVASGLRNARLYEKTQRQAAREMLVNEINQKISGTNDIERAMQVAARELGKAIGAQHTSVRLINVQERRE